MSGETNLNTLLKNMTPVLNDGDYVYCTVTNTQNININEAIGIFKEEEAITVILKKETADRLKLDYSYIAAWITLTIHSSLEATGLTAAFATALAKEEISCNVVAAYYHDHIFVAKKDAERAMAALRLLAEQKSHI
ncbi:ACT domain-containing protein [Mucilaginibacter flavus]|uniref:ACT domain-containing protein n=1 Tax=Mucilaginibacter flavus TaxID=931504 RepID=UPI0025B49149|nr:ACT domain-containing protein [Mucilaginibacter flavus]MDN3581215.1 ACT domain-containing protein [Mucilaginibacter flavus]